MSAVIEQNHLPSGKYILNHDIMNCTAEGVVANHLYSGRALGISEPGDIIQLHPQLRTEWDDITAHYQRVGLVHSHNVIWDLDLAHLGSHVGHSPSVFYFGPQECRAWGDGNWLNTVEFINSKNNFMLLAEELGVDVPMTVCFDSVSKIDDLVIAQLDFPCYLKAAVSVSGVGIYRCADEAELLEAISRFDVNVPVQVQQEVVTDTFLNMQFQVRGDQLCRLAVSEQVLDGFVHQGNRVPASHEPWTSVEPMAQWLKERDIKGIFAFDVAVVQTRQGLRFLAIECNPRFNGASYPTLISQKMDIPEWTSLTFDTRFSSLGEIDIRDVEYDHVTGEGAIIVNWGTVSEGKLMILLAGSSDYQEALALELQARL